MNEKPSRTDFGQKLKIINSVYTFWTTVHKNQSELILVKNKIMLLKTLKKKKLIYFGQKCAKIIIRKFRKLDDQELVKNPEEFILP